MSKYNGCGEPDCGFCAADREGMLTFDGGRKIHRPTAYYPNPRANYLGEDQPDMLEFGGGMKRSSAAGKVNYLLTRDGPLYERWALHLSKGAWAHSPRNWMLAAGEEELERFRESATRHFEQWLRGDTDEDHAAAVVFNINGAEYVKDRLDPIATDEEIAAVRAKHGTP